jgi:hypothetical protein
MSISIEKKIACLVGILPVMMDFMEDVRDTAPILYSQRIKRSGNDFMEELEKRVFSLYNKIKDEDDKELSDFYNDVQALGLAFRQWLADDQSK